MNEQFPNHMNPEDEKIATKLSQTAEQTQASAQFAAELEERLRSGRQMRSSGFAKTFRQISPTLRWATLLILLAAVLSWSIRTLIPAPQPAAQDTPVPTDLATPTADISPDATVTPAPGSEGYDWRGTKLYLSAALPESPAQASVFIVQPEQPATLEGVRALADEFGMQGAVYEGELEPNASSAFIVVDGNQRLYVRSDRYFQYIPDYTKWVSGQQVRTDESNAGAIIAEFMTDHNFTFPYSVEPSELYQGYDVRALAPDGLPIQHEFFKQNGLLFLIDQNEIIMVQASLLGYDPIGSYGIQSYEEALQRALGSDPNGVIEGMHSASGKPPVSWRRSYPSGQSVTVYGMLSSIPSVDGQSPLFDIDGFTVRGNLTGAENLANRILVRATGQFVPENGVMVFQVEAWEVYNQADHGYGNGKEMYEGRLEKQGEQVLLVTQERTLRLPDVPAEIPLPLEGIYIYGVTIGDTFEWELIEHYEEGSRGGGGGGGGMGFYQLNLSGTPVTFPSPTSQPDSAQESGTGAVEYVVQENDTLSSLALNFGTTVDELMRINGLTNETIFLGQTLIVPGEQTGQSVVGQRVEGTHGILFVTIYRKADGSERTEYRLQPMNNAPALLLQGENLQELQVYHNLPVSIWGTVDHIDQNESMVVNLERFEIPFPDLRIQLFRGKQRVADVDGQPVVLFTAQDGTTYAQMMTFDVPDSTTILGVEGDEVVLEGRAIPGDTFGGYPTLHVFSGSIATNPKDGQSTEPAITADQPYVVDETEQLPGVEPADLPTATIERVELVYYIADPRYMRPDPGSSAQYIQPAWRFYGHYSNGDEFEMLIQALEQEYLLPELAPFTRPG